MTEVNPHDVKEQYKDELFDIEGVQYVGVDDATGEIIVGYLQATPGIQGRLPAELDGVAVRTERVSEIGPELDAQPSINSDTGLADRTGRISPIVGGISIGHENATAGTTGFNGTDGSETYKLSNNHVMADTNAGSVGDDIHQPGPIHDDDEKVGELAGYVPIEDGTVVDVAWAEITEDEIDPEIAGLGGPYGEIYEPKAGDTLVSSGITTGVSSAKVRAVDATIRVNFDNETIRFDEQIITDSMSGPGDSGSPVLYQGRPAGLLFAGSSEVTVVNSASNIEEQTGLTIETVGRPAATLESATWTFPARPYTGRDVRWDLGVADGDTYWVELDQGFRDRTVIKGRAKLLDTAEIWGNSGPEELKMAQRQRDFVRAWMQDAIDSYDGEWPLLVRTEQAKGDRGRWLLDVYNRREQSLAAAVLDEFGTEYVYDQTTAEEIQERLDTLSERL